jgi:hypothetical protein
MRKGLVKIAVEKGEIALRGGNDAHSVHNLSYEDIRKARVHVLGNLGIDVLNTSVSVFFKDKDVQIYLDHEHKLTLLYKENLSAVEVLREVYQKIRGW